MVNKKVITVMDQHMNDATISNPFLLSSNDSAQVETTRGYESI
jgi:hypothetical protein